MPLVFISENCVGCGACVDACPTKALIVDGVSKFANESACVGHKKCIEACPCEALKWE